MFLAILLGPGDVHASAPSTLRIGLIDRFNNRPAIAINNTSLIFHGHGDAAFFQSPAGFTVRPYGSRYAALYDGSGRIWVSDFMLLYDGYALDMVTIDGISFRGGIEFARLGSGVTAVNWVSMEEYLFSVVPSEMPATWHLEALKAQAVAARTYALYTMERSIHTGFDLCNTVCCQVYHGVEWEHENSTNAVLATAGLALYFGGELIEAVYSASSGGFTENSENVWLEARPYLRGVPDPFEFEPVMWTRTFKLAELTNLLAQNNRNIGSATGMAVSSITPFGRVERLIIHGTAGQTVLEREEIRTFFSPAYYGSLQSRIFTLGGVGHVMPPLPPPVPAPLSNVAISDGQSVQNVAAVGLYGIAAQGSPTAISSPVVYGAVAAVNLPQTDLTSVSGQTVVIAGRGFGHGVGMSQRGAEGMARRGHNFREILTHFYTGTTIE